MQEVILYRGLNKTFEIIPNKTIHWPKRDEHPKDTPDCGFDGSLCKTESKSVRILLFLWFCQKQIEIKLMQILGKSM